MIVAELLLLYSRSVRAGCTIYQQMLNSLLHSPLQLIESLSAGQIINRLSGDLYSIEVRLVQMLIATSAGWIFTGEVLVYVAIIRPTLTIFIVLSVPAVYYVTKIYLATSSQLKRSESITRGKIFSQIKECNDGRTTIPGISESLTSYQNVRRTGRCAFADFHCYLQHSEMDDDPD